MALSAVQRRAWEIHQANCTADGENVACWGPTPDDYALVDSRPQCDCPFSGPLWSEKTDGSFDWQVCEECPHQDDVS